MRATILLLLCSLQFMYAGNSYSQTARVSIKMKNVQLDKVLSEIEAQTDYLFIYNNKVKAKQPKLSVDVVNKPVNTLLSEMLNNTDMTYSMEGNHIILSIKEAKVQAVQQAKTISGTIVDVSGEPLIGVSVAIKGTTTGTMTDIDGKFTLSANDGDIIVISYVGYKSQEFTVGSKTVFNIVLQEGDIALDEVVVTALGIKRAEKALSYNVQKISSEDLNTVKDANFMNSLTGKVAGVNINSSATGIGGAVRVVMRGTKSITKDNNAFYVIDGVPLMNINNGSLNQNDQYADQPRGEGISDINSDDIESMTVLTGPSAAALYGSAAANGAIIITTKKGKTGKPQITVSNQTTFSDPLMMHEFQNTYGNMPGVYSSWGAKQENGPGYNPKDFFNTAVNSQTSLSLSVGSEKNQTYVSISNVTGEGLLDNNTLDKYTLTFRNTTSFLNDKMTLDAGLTYVDQKDKNMLGSGRYFNPLLALYTYPRGESVEELRLYETYNSATGISQQNWKWGLGELDLQNPLWQMNRNIRSTNRRRIMANVNLDYKINEWLSLAGRVRVDETSGDYSQKLYASTPTKFAASEKGHYTFRKEEETQRYADIIGTVNKRWDDFSLFTNVGASIFDMKYSAAGARGPLKLIPNFFSLMEVDPFGSNGSMIQDRWREQSQSIFASAETGWKDMLYLSLTGRADWASQLANTEQKSFFYPSVGLSGLVHEMVSLPKAISFLKVRGSWASVGSAIPRNISIETLKYAANLNSWNPDKIRPITNLKPERTNSWEAGISAKFLRNTISVDATYYHSNTKNQTFLIPTSTSSGYKEMYLQSGNVENKGIELTVAYNNNWGGFAWNSSFTASHNKNKIIELMDNYYDAQTDAYYSLDRYSGGGSTNLEFILKKGGTMGDLWSKSRLALDENGYYYVDPATNKVKSETAEEKVGSVLPKWNLGFRNDFSWKGINLGVVVTARLGGIVSSNTQAILDGYGVSKASAIARDAGGVAVNNGMMDAQTWYQVVGLEQVMSYYIYSATNVRLQELSLGYSLPSEWFNNKVRVKASFVGRNLWMIYCKAPFDPELTASTGTFMQGIDYFMQPSLRSLGFNIQLQF
ncbi:TonB-linked SusC/RagA family outer membrane protein [Dysgonomonas hofstadii]|uniref:TonB-linked SusC/RagA family outer membrane protein n=1 Tax=Dysgonomonas hofstadii TaxID=637886 RepID=A0A840CP70_9BACT|nr:SusC/RagA family TonB-linked outer membrane protein [Dysgonomonas hofstadii]MBB4037897.1 TonB-linked SusC/RagA family outer membrane protein [Dysgonomonas hofstadii]